MPGQETSRPATVRLGLLIRRVVLRHRDELGNGPLVLAVSGGADSLAMLFAAATVQRSLRRELVVAHFSHGIRRTAERGEASLVRRTAGSLGVPIAHEQAYLKGDEASARQARYAFLARVASEHTAVAVLTAHTQDDQAETLLLRLVRGSGLHGAGAIREMTTRQIDGERLKVLRPMLEATRKETEAVCREWGVTPASDGTNRSLHYARNRIRRRVLPELEAINPDVRAALAAFATEAQEDDDLLLETMVRLGYGRADSTGDDFVEWETSTLRQMPLPLLIRRLQSARATLGPKGGALSRRQVESIERVLERGAGSVDLGEGLLFSVEQEGASLRRSAPRREPPSTVDLPIPGITRFGGWTVTATVGPPGGHAAGQWTAVLDADALGKGVHVRSRARGDRFQPLGMTGDVRLQDVLVNAKVPRSERDAVPLVVSARGIAWVCGVRIAEWAKVTEQTTHVAVIKASQAC